MDGETSGEIVCLPPFHRIDGFSDIGLACDTWCKFRLKFHLMNLSSAGEDPKTTASKVARTYALWRNDSLPMASIRVVPVNVALCRLGC